MLNALKLRRVGPAKELKIELKPRMNFLTGDNGLGKSFLLDVAWWALTRVWAREVVIPWGARQVSSDKDTSQPAIFFDYSTRTKPSHPFSSTFDRKVEEWSVKQGRPPIPGLVMYAQVDGGFSVWDPARNYWKNQDPERPGAYLFEQPSDVWNGLRDFVSGRSLCEGLLRDWASWQRENGEAFAQLTRVLKQLSPSPDEPLKPGPLKRISISDVLDQPTLQMPYQQSVALVHASAGIRRVVALAYLLVWTWREHVLACELLEIQPEREIIFLIDEVEAHLHPQWQRRIVPALLDVMEALTGTHDVSIQLFAATHSPLVLASTETRFDLEQDAIWELDLEDSEVTLNKFAFTKRGDANTWLTSSVFDLKQPRSLQAEEALTAALELLRQDTPEFDEVKRVDALLRESLSDVDRFWIRWSAFVEGQEEAAP